MFENFSQFFGEKTKEYTEEASAAKHYHEAAKEFAQTYQSEEYQQRIRLKDLLEGGGSGSSPEGNSDSFGEFEGTIQEKFWQYFVKAGYSKQAVAGMMGNVQHESGFLSDKIEQTPGETYGEGYGLIQWSYGRKERLINEAKKRGKEVNDVQFQFDFLNMELNESGNWMSTWANYPFDTFKKTTDIKYATEAFCWMFERPNVNLANISGRIEYANKYYKEFANKDFSKKKTSSAKGSALAKKLIQEAEKHDGENYTQNIDPNLGPTRTSPGYWDCSSLMREVFQKVIGRDIGNVTREQEYCGRMLSVDQRKPGDLCLFGQRGATGHIALYCGDDIVFHASDYDRGVLHDEIYSNFWPDFIVRIKELEE